MLSGALSVPDVSHLFDLQELLHQEFRLHGRYPRKPLAGVDIEVPDRQRNHLHSGYLGRTPLNTLERDERILFRRNHQHRATDPRCTGNGAVGGEEDRDGRGGAIVRLIALRNQRQIPRQAVFLVEQGKLVGGSHDRDKVPVAIFDGRCRVNFAEIDDTLEFYFGDKE